MSTQTEITRLQEARNKIRTWEVGLGIATSTDKLDELATKSLFTNKELSDLMLQKKIQDNIAKDKTKSDAERNAALEKSRKLQVIILPKTWTTCEVE